MNSSGVVFFCTRPNGSITPLIPMDELPHDFLVHGVPRVLCAADTQGMVSCGMASPRESLWTVEGHGTASQGNAQVTTVEGLGSRENIRKILVEVMKLESTSPQLRQEISDALLKYMDHGDATCAQSMAVVPALPSGQMCYYGTMNNAKPQVPSTKKEYCSYWIRHGECDYQQQGCLYRHEMPIEPELLEKLGLRDIPRWYREKFGLPSLLQPGNGSRLQQSYQAMAEQPLQKAIQYGNHQEVMPLVSSGTNNQALGNSGTQLYPRGQSGKASKSPRGGHGGNHARNRGQNFHGTHYKHGHNATNTQSISQAQSTQQTNCSFKVPNVSLPKHESTFAQVVSRPSKHPDSEASPSPNSSNNSPGGSGGTNISFPRVEQDVGLRSDTHEAIHHSIMNPGENMPQLNRGMHQLDAFGLPPVTKTEGDFRKGSRRLFDASCFGNDGSADSWNPATQILVDVFEDPAFAGDLDTMANSTSNLVSSDDITAKSSSVTRILNSLVAESEPLANKRALANWGPVGETASDPEMAKAKFQDANVEEITELKLALNETEGAQDPLATRPSAITIARLGYDMATIIALKGDKVVAAEWLQFAYEAHAKAAFAWRMKVNAEYAAESFGSRDVYTTWRRKRGVDDFPYVTGSRAGDLKHGFRIPFSGPRECARRDSWLRLHKRMMREANGH